MWVWTRLYWSGVENGIQKVCIFSPCCVCVHRTVLVTFCTTHHDHCPDLNPVIPVEDVLKNGSTDNALPLVWALTVTKWEHVHCWCCIPAGTIPLFSKPESGRLNWTTPPTFPNNPATPPPPYTSPFPPSALQPTNHPTHHPLLPYTHPLVSCPYLGRDVLSAGCRGGGRGGRALGWHKGGRRRNSEHSQPFLNKDMSGIQARLSEESLFFCSTSLEHSLVRTQLHWGRPICVLHTVSFVILTAHSAEEVCSVFSAIIGDKQ